MTPRIQGGKPLQKRKAPAQTGASHETNKTTSGYHTAGAKQGETMEAFNSIVEMLVRHMTVNRRGAL